MVFKWLAGVLVLAGVVWGIGQTSGSSAATQHSSLSAKKPGFTCITDRDGRYCLDHPIVENSGFAISPDGKNAYSILRFLGEEENEHGAVEIYDRDPTTGSLVQKRGTAGCIAQGRVKGCQRGRALYDGTEIRVSPDGRSVYANTQDNSLAIFDRDPLTGALSQKPGAEGCFAERSRYPTCAPNRGLSVAELAFSPDGKNVYFAGSSLMTFDRDPATGALTRKPGLEGTKPGVRGGSVEVSPDGKNVYATTSNPDGVATFNRDPNTGVLTRVPGPAGCVSEKGEGGCRRGHEFSISTLAISPDGRSVYGIGIVYPKVGVLAILDRLPDGTLIQKPGRAGCIGGESRQACAEPFSLQFLAAENDITVSADGKRVYVFEYTFPGEGEPLIRHSSGRLTWPNR